MFYYPLSTLMLAGIRDILLISTAHDLPALQRLLVDGNRSGINLTMPSNQSGKAWLRPLSLNATLSAVTVSHWFLATTFLRSGISEDAENASSNSDGATIFGYQFTDSEQYGAVDFDKAGRVISLEEKPIQP